MKQTLFSIAALVALTHAARTKQTARPTTPTSTQAHLDSVVNKGQQELTAEEIKHADPVELPVDGGRRLSSSYPADYGLQQGGQNQGGRYTETYTETYDEYYANLSQWDCGDGRGVNTPYTQDTSKIPDNCCRVYRYKYFMGPAQDYCYAGAHGMEQSYNDSIQTGSIRCGEHVESEVCERGNTVYDQYSQKYVTKGCDAGQNGLYADITTVNHYSLDIDVDITFNTVIIIHNGSDQADEEEKPDDDEPQEKPVEPENPKESQPEKPKEPVPEKPKEPEPKDPEDCPPEVSQQAEQTLTLYQQKDCSGALMQDLTGKGEAEADFLKYGGQMQSMMVPRFATVVFYKDYDQTGSVHEVFNSETSPRCLDLCDMKFIPKSAQVFFTDM